MKTRNILISFLLFCLSWQNVVAQHSIARQWNEVLLQAIRSDFARPTVHARNLFHTSVAMYDAWAIFDDEASPYLMGKRLGEYNAPLADFAQPANIQEARRAAISYAAYRLIKHRFAEAPGRPFIYNLCDNLMLRQGYDTSFVSTDYLLGSGSALGNYIASQIIQYGLQDGSNEADSYTNQYYEPINGITNPRFPSISNLVDPNRWQPLGLGLFIDQSGNPLEDGAPKFLSPEWGWVRPFAMTEEDADFYVREGLSFQVYHDPGPPPFLFDPEMEDYYRKGFQMVSIWSSHLDPADSIYWDISPASIGNTDINAYPRSMEDLLDYYNYLEGGDIGTGHNINPYTGQHYAPNMVLRGDYTRVLAEFWADGPDSETPPGHWYTILNYVNDHPELQKKWKGEGDPLDDLEWDVKCYLTLGGAMHDAAIAAWSVKGYYDYIRPISAIRFMGQSQSTDSTLPNYSPTGLELIPGLIEIVQAGDPLEGVEGEHIGKIKLYTWRGPTYIENPNEDMAGVGWILAENWWPYQRPSFVTPPFAGYVSGHSTYSRAAADILTMITGDPFFPGGMGEFQVGKNEFLVFEEGPSKTFTLQWATYRDASDQTSLSRIWGGIHPPADDIPGRLMGELVAEDAFALAERYFEGEASSPISGVSELAYPNPVSRAQLLQVPIPTTIEEGILQFVALDGRVLFQQAIPTELSDNYLPVPVGRFAPGIYLMRVVGKEVNRSQKIVVQP